jgi:hypothetical protein
MKLSSAKLVVEALRKNEVPFIGVLPDGWLFDAYQLICEDPYFKVVQVTHEAKVFQFAPALGPVVCAQR